MERFSTKQNSAASSMLNATSNAAGLAATNTRPELSPTKIYKNMMSPAILTCVGVLFWSIINLDQLIIMSSLPGGIGHNIGDFVSKRDIYPDTLQLMVSMAACVRFGLRIGSKSVCIEAPLFVVQVITSLCCLLTKSSGLFMNDNMDSFFSICSYLQILGSIVMAGRPLSLCLYNRERFLNKLVDGNDILLGILLSRSIWEIGLAFPYYSGVIVDSKLPILYFISFVYLKLYYFVTFAKQVCVKLEEEDVAKMSDESSGAMREKTSNGFVEQRDSYESPDRIEHMIVLLGLSVMFFANSCLIVANCIRHT